MEKKVQDPVFGELIWDEEYNWWKTKVEFEPDSRVDVQLSGNRNRILEKIDQYQKIFERFRQNEAAARQFAAENLLDLHNESWREDDEPEITGDEFIRRIKPESIAIYEDLTATVYYHDDDLFWGHVILLSSDENGKFTEATIAG